jgi:2-iminobutanoate/2-iminopropanoate deaminase
MISRLPSHVGDPTCSSAVIAGGFVFLAHHGGGYDVPDPAHQARAALTSLAGTLEAAGSAMSDVVQLHLYLRDAADLRAACDVFPEFFGDAAPARTTTTSSFVDDACLVQVDGIALAR